ncbi:hypothetical protein [Blautia stercoris]
MSSNKGMLFVEDVVNETIDMEKSRLDNFDELKPMDVVSVKTEDAIVFGKIFETGVVNRLGQEGVKYIVLSILDDVKLQLFENDIVEIVQKDADVLEKLLSLNQKYKIKQKRFSGDFDVLGWIVFYASIWEKLLDDERDCITNGLTAILSKEEMFNVMVLISNLKIISKNQSETISFMEKARVKQDKILEQIKELLK